MPSTTTRRPAPPGPQSRYAADRWTTLGTYAALVVADADQLAAARAVCEQILDRIDRTCSRFRADSDLTRANLNPGTWVPVDPLLVQALTVAVEVARSTDGLVDPTLGRHLVSLGYDRDLAAVRRAEVPTLQPSVRPSEAPTMTAPLPGAWREIGIDPDGAIRVPDGVSLDLGASAKAFAADLIAAAVPVLAGTALVISLGGDVAVGRTEDDETEHQWRIAVAERPEDAYAPDAEVVVLTDGGMATSSTLARHWHHHGTAMHHLLDPRTGLPVDPTWRTVSVCSATCVEANAASTSAIVRGGPAPAWLEQIDQPARLVAADGQVVRVAGWPEPEPETQREPETQPEPEIGR